MNADPTRIQQVVLNLAIDARDALPQGGCPELELERVPALPPDLRPISVDGAETGGWIRL